MARGVWFVGLVVAFVVGVTVASVADFSDIDAKKRRRPAAPPCPAETQLFARVCFEPDPRSPALFDAAAQFCADLDRRLPTSAVLDGLRRSGTISLATGGEWTSDFVLDADTVLVLDGADGYITDVRLAERAFRCVV